MYPSTGLQTALNKMREMSVDSNSIYHQYIPVVTSSSSIADFGTPILDPANTAVLNDFVGLLKKVIYTAVYSKTFNSPLAQLEGESMPLGQFIEDVYVNPVKARGFNINDFAGLLQKYSAEVATQYLTVNSDLQYCVTITREKLRNAFTSWSNLEEFITGMTNALYNGAYITRYNQTKGLPLAAFKKGAIKYEVTLQSCHRQHYPSQTSPAQSKACLQGSENQFHHPGRFQEESGRGRAPDAPHTQDFPRNPLPHR